MLTVWFIGFVISLIIDAVCYVSVVKFNVDIPGYHDYTGDFNGPLVIVANIFFAVIWPVMLVLTVMKLLEVK